MPSLQRPSGVVPAKKVKEIKEKFRELDENGDGTLEIQELEKMLRNGNPDMTHHECKVLFRSVDKSGDGVVGFEEFVDFVYGETHKCHLKRQSPSKDSNAQEESDWKKCDETFRSFAGSDGSLQASEFRRVCRDAKLFDDVFTVEDVDVVFKAVCRGQRQLTVKGFRRALKAVAVKKGCPEIVVRGQVAIVKGPVMQATKAQEQRLHVCKNRSDASVTEAEQTN